MKTVGIIAEYNPFHNGHAYHIRKAKELTGAVRNILHAARWLFSTGWESSIPCALAANVVISGC